MIAHSFCLPFCFVVNSNGATAPFNRGAPAPFWLGRIAEVVSDVGDGGGSVLGLG